MADFSFPCLSPSFLHSDWLPHNPISVPPSLSGFVGDLEDSFFSCYSSDPHHNDIAPDITLDGESCSENKYRRICSGVDSRESPIIEPQSSDKVTLLKKTEMEKIKNNDQFKDVKQGKDKKKKHNKETPPTDYVHVRARRGEATDKHSLAERARREKISKKMKHLQALVPGCDQINNKVLVLDAIINHVQSLQNQVEHLSMEVASMNYVEHGFGEELNDFMKLGSLPENASAAITTPLNDYPKMDSTVCLSLQHRQRPIVLCEDKADLFIGGVKDQKQMLITQSSPGFDNFCNF